MAQKNEDNLQLPPFIELLTIDSTNNYALNLLRQPYLTDRQATGLHGTTIFAHEQRQGKGQRGKKWASAPGENVQMSVIIAPQTLPLHQQFTLTVISALAVRGFLSKLTGMPFSIKWPNDIYFQDRKAGGILIENIIGGAEWKWAVVGIGLNINQIVFDRELPNPISLKQITGKEFDCVDLAKELSGRIFEEVAGRRVRDAGNTNVISTGAKRSGEISGDGSVSLGSTQHDGQKKLNLFSEYNKHLYKRGEKVKLKKGSRVFEATIKQVAENGQLIVETGMEELFDFGEVVWVV